MSQSSSPLRSSIVTPQPLTGPFSSTPPIASPSPSSIASHSIPYRTASHPESCTHLHPPPSTIHPLKAKASAATYRKIIIATTRDLFLLLRTSQPRPTTTRSRPQSRPPLLSCLHINICCFCREGSLGIFGRSCCFLLGISSNALHPIATPSH